MSLYSTVSFRGLGGDGGATPCTCFGRKGNFVGMYWGPFSECVKVSREICVRDIGYEKRLYNMIPAWGKCERLYSNYLEDQQDWIVSLAFQLPF
jgi:hypothetical protein